MSVERTKALEYAKINSEFYFEKLITFTSIPSISTGPEYKSDAESNAHWVSEEFSDLGLDNFEIFPTKGHSLVYAESLKVEGAPTMFFFNMAEQNDR